MEPDKGTPSAETYNPATGLTNVDESSFEIPEDAEDTPENGGESTPATPPAPDPDQPPANPDPSKPATTPEPPKPAEPVLLAGKYSTEQELKNAFVQLGGDPNKFDTTEKLEQAYEVRQAEFTRVRQEQNEARRINEEVDKKDSQAQLLSEENLTKMMEQVPWDKIGDAKQMFVEMAKVLLANVPTNQMPSEQDLVARMTPMIQERESKLTELHDLETKVPRLKSDPSFRKAFAYHVQGEQQEGAYQGIGQAMKNFLKFNQGIVDEVGKSFADNAAAKNDAGATTPPDGGANMGGAPKPSEDDDILGGIVSAYNDHTNKYSGK
jgi:hypothetical protein